MKNHILPLGFLELSSNAKYLLNPSKFDPKAHLSENVFKGMIDEFSSKFSNLKKYFSSYFGYFMARSCQIIKKYKILMIFWQNSSNTIGRFPIEIKT